MWQSPCSPVFCSFGVSCRLHFGMLNCVALPALDLPAWLLWNFQSHGLRCSPWLRASVVQLPGLHSLLSEARKTTTNGGGTQPIFFDAASCYHGWLHGGPGPVGSWLRAICLHEWLGMARSTPAPPVQQAWRPYSMEHLSPSIPRTLSRISHLIHSCQLQGL
jgi:hypothetical protein